MFPNEHIDPVKIETSAKLAGGFRLFLSLTVQMESMPPEKARPPSWNELPEQLKRSYTLEHAIPVKEFYLNDSAEQAPPVWSTELIECDIVRAQELDANLASRSYDAASVRDLYAAIARYPVASKSVLVVGSRNPWIEAVCLAFGAASVTTVDYNVPRCQHTRIRCIGMDEHLREEDVLYDRVFSFSSLEHDGLGRYGDPLDPGADLKSTCAIARRLAADGLLFLGVPMGVDRLEYNAHRIYGPVRWPLLVADFDEVDAFSSGVPHAEFFDRDRTFNFQPWVVLRRHRQ